MSTHLPTKPRSPLAQAQLELALERARAIAKKSRADATWRAYQSDWRQFEAYCQQLEFSPLPASEAVLLAFLAAQSDEGKAPSTIQRRLVAIRLVHQGSGFELPDRSFEVSELMKGIRRRWLHPKARKTPAVAADVMAMVDCVDPESNKGLRDRALLLFGFASALRRSELVAIELAHLEYEDRGVKVTIPHSKTDQENEGQKIAVRLEPESSYCPVQAIKDWITVADITSGPIFLRCHRHDRIGKKPMTPQSVALIVKEYALRVGLEPAHYAGHSLRRGFLTAAAQERKSIFKMAEHSRHKSLEVMRHYVDEELKFDDHAGEGLLRSED